VGALLDYSKAHEMDATLPEVKANLSDTDKADEAVNDIKRALGKFSKSNDHLSDAIVRQAKSKQELEKSDARLRRLLSGDERTEAQKLADFARSEKLSNLDEEDYYDRAGVFVNQKKYRGKYEDAIADYEKALH
jgi:tetratricopeptide (TPR) repeat protein